MYIFYIFCFGRCNVYNVLFVIGVLYYFGCIVVEIRSGFCKMEKLYGWLIVIKNYCNMIVINDSFNIKFEFDFVFDVLNYVGLVRGRKIVVLGDI